MDIKSIQKELKENNLFGEIFTLGNLFLEEDILEEENQILELTGFSGSYALLFITQKKAYLFVDGRYELQAKKETDRRLVEIVKLSEICFTDWLKQNLIKQKHRIAYNPWLISIDTLNKLQTAFPQTEFVPTPKPDMRLSPQKAKIFSHAKKFSGLTSTDKITALTRYIKNKKLDAVLISSAASVSWLLNLRSNALPYTPLFRAYALVTKTGQCTIFAGNTDCKNALPFKALPETLAKYASIGADFCTTPAIIKDFYPTLSNTPDNIIKEKSIKNKTELKGCENAHIRDGAALSKFLCWLSKNYVGKTETDVAAKLLNFRKKELNFYSESFATIAASGANGAIVHYHASKEKAATLKKNTLFLLDSGAQYLDGTTDVTRTVALGTPTPDMIEKNTLVLKAHIALASAVFPENTRGSELDILARLPLLKHNLDYKHGTGHGVGCFSNVHEGPARISLTAKNAAPLKAGMITSIEPGYYKENAFGIRIENLYRIVKAPKSNLLKFEVLTLAPIDLTLINKYLLSQDEINWLNSYHAKVLSTLKKYMTKQELDWLKKACAPL
ncbi:MAG: aminopeptidase P family protein [Alphaproteobacteria bacterium]|nr:aminopeptidase P family protein [Alphaproteobacteria bacterium]MBO5441590.1 aminopeptidase P family protein [Alphaproteobacteria bacterium]